MLTLFVGGYCPSCEREHEGTIALELNVSIMSFMLYSLVVRCRDVFVVPMNRVCHLFLILTSLLSLMVFLTVASLLFWV